MSNFSLWVRKSTLLDLKQKIRKKNRPIDEGDLQTHEIEDSVWYIYMCMFMDIYIYIYTYISAFLFFLKMLLSKHKGLLTDLSVLAGVNRSGRLAGRFLSYSCRKPTSWCRVMMRKLFSPNPNTWLWVHICLCDGSQMENIFPTP